jgi:integrase/recombinase XerD
MSQAKTLSPAEYDKLFAYIAERKFAIRNKLILLTGFKTGMRVSEIAQIRLGMILNSENQVKSEFRLTAELTKGGFARTVYIPTGLQEELQKYIDLRGDFNPAHPLFVTAGGKAFTPNVLTQHLFWQFRNAGISNASSHTMRRQYITSLATRGVSIKVLATLAGHRSIQVTAKYIDTNPDLLRNAAELA